MQAIRKLRLDERTARCFYSPATQRRAGGVSGTSGYDQRTTTDRDDPARQFKLARSYVSVSVAIFPHVLWQRK